MEGLNSFKTAEVKIEDHAAHVKRLLADPNVSKACINYLIDNPREGRFVIVCDTSTKNIDEWRYRYLDRASVELYYGMFLPDVLHVFDTYLVETEILHMVSLATGDGRQYTSTIAKISR